MNRFNSKSAFRDSLKKTTYSMTVAPASTSMGLSAKPFSKAKPKAKSNMKSYGQKGYTPSTGKGVGY